MSLMPSLISALSSLAIFLMGLTLVVATMMKSARRRAIVAHAPFSHLRVIEPDGSERVVAATSRRDAPEGPAPQRPAAVFALRTGLPS